MSKAKDGEGPLRGEEDDDYEWPEVEKEHEIQETIVNDIQKDHRVALSTCVPNGNHAEDADKDYPWAKEVPDLLSALRSLRSSYNKQYEMAQQEPSEIIRSALFGAVSSLKRMTDGLVERMKSVEYRKRYNFLDENGRVCEFCFTAAKSADRVISLFKARCCERCKRSLTKFLE